jgi:eukaryotic-like serine/threonine-protein kinase
MKQCEKCNRKFPDHMVFCPFDGDILDSEVEDPLLGCVLDGKYRLEEKLGEGGMGTVYRAKHVLIDNDLAVKVLHSSLVADRHAVARFQREAMAAARIKHPNAVGVTDFGITELEDSRAGQIVYIVMELFIGESLRDIIEREGPLPVDRAVSIIRQVCLALDVAHRNGIIHRDVKPDNIVIDKNGQGELVKVLDFGIAKLKDGPTGENRGRLTRQGVIIGSPHYLSPEQCQNTELDSRSDIYSLGIVLYEMLTGDVPFKAPTPIAVAMMHTTDQPVPVREKRPDIPDSIEHVVMRALEKLPENRPQTALELALELENACLDSSLYVKPLSGSAASMTLLNDTTDSQSRPLATTRIPARSGDSFPPEAVPPGPAPNNGAGSVSGVGFLKEENPPARKHTTASMSPDRPANVSSASQELFDSGSTSISGTSSLSNVNLFQLAQTESQTETRRNGFLLVAVASILVLAVGMASYFVYFILSNDTTTQPAAVNKTPDPAAEAPPGMIYIKGGSFKMGRNLGEKYDGPEHEVEVGSFYIDKTEVTNEDYKKFVDAAGYIPPRDWKNGSYPAGDALKPVTGVDWTDAAAYAKWAGKRLPTEVEWEYSARGTDGRSYPWGNEWQDGAAVSKEMSIDGPRQVGSLTAGASAFGALDMAGNVWEWTADTFSPYPGYKQSIESRLRGLKIIRGGSFKSDKRLLTSYLRNMVEPGFRDVALGFRCAKSAQ